MPIKYTPELKQRAIELVLHAQADPVTARGAVTRIAAELGASQGNAARVGPQTQRNRGRLPGRIDRPGSRKPQAANRTRRNQTRQRYPQEGLSFFAAEPGRPQK